MTGQDIFDLANTHVGDPYLLGVTVPKNQSKWKGPWDCAEFASWLVFQVSNKLYGCDNDLRNPATADAYTGYWRDDAEDKGKIIPVADAISITGAAILRVAAEGKIGHIVISDGHGGTVEAHSHVDGVINSVVNGRRWDYGILVPWINYTSLNAVPYAPPNYIVYRYKLPMMVNSKVGEIQQKLIHAGFDTHGIDNIFGLDTLHAVEAFQQSKNLVVDGEVGKDTAAVLGVGLL